MEFDDERPGRRLTGDSSSSVTLAPVLAKIRSETARLETSSFVRENTPPDVKADAVTAQLEAAAADKEVARDTLASIDEYSPPDRAATADNGIAPGVAAAADNSIAPGVAAAADNGTAPSRVTAADNGVVLGRVAAADNSIALSAAALAGDGFAPHVETDADRAHTPSPGAKAYDDAAVSEAASVMSPTAGPPVAGSGNAPGAQSSKPEVVVRFGRLARLARWARRRPIVATLLFLTVAYTVYCVASFLTLPSVEQIKTDLAKNRPKLTALMAIRQDEHDDDGKKYKIRQAWLPLSRIDEDLVHAVITTEDANFYGHDGIDWEELELSLKQDLEDFEAPRGASTITQQLAKNLYLDPSRSVLRKVREMVVAKRLEDGLSKSRILELYLNLIEWGPGVFGCELAAQSAFGHSANDLDRDEAAKLAAVIASPLKHSAGRDDKWVAHRTKLILRRMEARGW